MKEKTQQYLDRINALNAKALNGISGLKKLKTQIGNLKIQFDEFNQLLKETQSIKKA